MKEYVKMSGREILDSFGKLLPVYQFDRLCSIRPKKVLNKFHKCSTNCQDVWIFDGRIKELEEKKLPYKVFKRIEWYVPNEEVEVK